MYKQLKHILCIIMLSAMLTACQTVSAPAPRSLSFNESRFALMINKITVETPSQLHEADIQHHYQMPMSLQDGVKAWLSDRIYKAGGENQLVAKIHRATIFRTTRMADKKWWQLEGSEDEIFTATLDVALTLYSPEGRKLAIANSSNEHKLTIPGDVDMSRRDALLNNLLVRTIQDMDLNFSRAIPQYMAPYLRAPD